MRTKLRSLVLGGQGFIGSHLINALLANGLRVRSFDQPGVLPATGVHSGNSDFELFEGDFLNQNDIINALADCDVCYHLISTTNPKSSNDNPVFDVESNVLGTIRLLSHAVQSGVKKIVFVSSGGTVYGVPSQVPILEDHPTDPICSYGISKLAIEKYLALFHEFYGLDYCILRVANPYGEGQKTNKGQGAIAVFLQKALRGEEIEIWGDGSVVRDYIHVEDVISALLAATAYGGTKRIFNIGSGKGLSLNEVLDSIDKVSSTQTRRRYIASRKYDVPSNILSISRAAKELEWAPNVEFDVGLSRFRNWLERV